MRFAVLEHPTKESEAGVQGLQDSSMSARPTFFAGKDFSDNLTPEVRAQKERMRAQLS